jgi:hypothetical protein
MLPRKYRFSQKQRQSNDGREVPVGEFQRGPR